MIFIEAFFESLLVAYLGIKHPLTGSFEDYSGEKWGYGFAYVVLVINIGIIPCLALLVIAFRNHVFKWEKTEMLLLSFYDGINTESRYKRSFMFVFLIKRMIYTYLIIYVTHSCI